MPFTRECNNSEMEKMKVKVDHNWQALPDCILMHIFNFLDAKHIVKAGGTCRHWQQVSHDEYLWKKLVSNRWNIRMKKLPPNKFLWKDEYKRLYFHSPVIWSELLTDHTDEVLYVTFTKHGHFFATVSRDVTVKVWEVGYPTMVMCDRDMQAALQWDCMHYACFNDVSTYLMVGGIKSRVGYGAILDNDHGLRVLLVFEMFPYGLGAWLDDSTFIAGRNIDRSNSLQIKAFKVPAGYEFYLPLESYGDVIYTFYHETDRFTDISIETFDCMPGTLQHSASKSEHDCLTSATDQQNVPGPASRWLKTISFVAGDYLLHIKNLNSALSSLASMSNILSCKVNNSELCQVLEHLGPNDPIIVENNIQLQSIDVPDHVVCLKGHVTGYKFVVSGDGKQKFLFYNYRPLTSTEEELSLGESIEMRALNLSTLEDIGISYVGHKAQSPFPGWRLYVDVTDDYVASGSEDNCGYLWDRHYHIQLTKYEHKSGVVNAVAFSPTDQEYAVTIGDDYTIKVWRSRHKMNQITPTCICDSQIYNREQNDAEYENT